MDGIMQAINLRTGDKFTLRGRNFTADMSGCTTIGVDKTGEYFTFHAWNAQHANVTVKVRTNSRIETS